MFQVYNAITQKYELRTFNSLRAAQAFIKTLPAHINHDVFKVNANDYGF